MKRPDSKHVVQAIVALAIGSALASACAPAESGSSKRTPIPSAPADDGSILDESKAREFASAPASSRPALWTDSFNTLNSVDFTKLNTVSAARHGVAVSDVQILNETDQARVLFNYTNIQEGVPLEKVVRKIAQICATEFGWDANKCADELIDRSGALCFQTKADTVPDQYSKLRSAARGCIGATTQMVSGVEYARATCAGCHSSWMSLTKDGTIPGQPTGAKMMFVNLAGAWQDSTAARHPGNAEADAYLDQLIAILNTPGSEYFTDRTDSSDKRWRAMGLLSDYYVNLNHAQMADSTKTVGETMGSTQAHIRDALKRGNRTKFVGFGWLWAYFTVATTAEIAQGFSAPLDAKARLYKETNRITSEQVLSLNAQGKAVKGNRFNEINSIFNKGMDTPLLGMRSAYFPACANNGSMTQCYANLLFNVFRLDYVSENQSYSMPANAYARYYLTMATAVSAVLPSIVGKSLLDKWGFANYSEVLANVPMVIETPAGETPPTNQYFAHRYNMASRKLPDNVLQVIPEADARIGMNYIQARCYVCHNRAQYSLPTTFSLPGPAIAAATHGASNQGRLIDGPAAQHARAVAPLMTVTAPMSALFQNYGNPMAMNHAVMHESWKEAIAHHWRASKFGLEGFNDWVTALSSQRPLPRYVARSSHEVRDGGRAIVAGASGATDADAEALHTAGYDPTMINVSAHVGDSELVLPGPSELGPAAAMLTALERGAFRVRKSDGTLVRVEFSTTHGAASSSGAATGGMVGSGSGSGGSSGGSSGGFPGGGY